MILQDKNIAAPGSEYERRKYLASLATVELTKNNTIKKTFHDQRQHFFENSSHKLWKSKYDALRSWDNRYVEVYRIEENLIEMQYIDGVSLKSILKDEEHKTVNEKIYIIGEYLDILSKSHRYVSHNTDYVFMHDDLNPSNVLVTKDNKLFIIDPDSCTSSPRLYKSFPSLLSNYTLSLHKYYELLKCKVRS